MQIFTQDCIVCLACSWDEWVGMDRLMKHTEENVEKQQALDKKQGVEKNKSGRSTQAKPKSSTGWYLFVFLLVKFTSALLMGILFK